MAIGFSWDGPAGADRPVVGGHTMGFNTGSIGVAVLNNIDGHRAIGATACLGALLFARLGDIRHRVDAFMPLYIGEVSGLDRGFSTDIPNTQGLHQVCVYVINNLAGAANAQLGCRTVAVP